MSHTLLVTIFGLMLLPGLAMTFVPTLPAFWLLMAVATGFALVDGFTHLTLENLFVLAAIFALSVLVEWSAGLLGGKLGGAAWKSLPYGAIGSVIGLFIIPPVGIFAGLFTGVLIGELLRQRAGKEAVRAAASTLVGSLSGVAINIVLALLFVVLFLVFAI